MLRKLAVLGSVLMHPLLMPTYLFALLFYYAPIVVERGVSNPDYLLLAIFLTTFLIPLVYVTVSRFLVIRKNYLAVISMPTRQERVLPFFFISLFYIIVTFLFVYKFNDSSVLSILLAAFTVIIIVASVATLFIKVSAYSASSSGLIGFIIGLGSEYPQAFLVTPLVIVLIISGLVMSSRLYIGSHEPKDILVGSIIGLAISLVSVWWFV
ncbi:MAG: phosphatase PAP2 family protein [Tunicatimonas sp.]|uniref:phosphatase PAP2 family protein n=1 Tax=Tunicatimonas sp. TaxID=1940096 RepID=UPI003C7953E5